MSAIDDRDDVDEIRAHGALPTADVEVVYRRNADAEFIGISIQPVPFSYGRLFAMSNPFQLWSQLAAAAWMPWLEGLRAFTAQPTPVRQLESDTKE